MSFNRNRYDACAYTTRLGESKGVLTYALDPSKFYRCHECRVPFGVVGGNNVTLRPENMVDVESELRNQVRIASICPQHKYLPHFPLNNLGGGTYAPPAGSHHLATCQLIKYQPRVKDVGYTLNFPRCPANPGALTYPGY